MERGIGDNSGLAPGLRISVRLFNSLARFGSGLAPADMELPAGSTVADVVSRLGIPIERIFLVLVNGKDVSAGLVGQIDLGRELEAGDRVALSGPVPYSWGYGAPVV